jgi:pimeloyl-ACP methyl ester carboxylesterase
MRRATTPDGTTIAYDRIGTGPPMIVVGGALQGRASYAPTAEGLARYFTVINFDRRGRGDSGDVHPYAVDREMEDIAALFDEVGGSAALYGHSSGSALALAVARSGLPVTHLVLHEPPFGNGSLEDRHAERAEADYICDLLQQCARAEAVRYFFTSMGLPRDVAESLAGDPTMQAHAPTLLYDYAIMDTHARAGRSLTQQALGVSAPTLILVGSASYDFVSAAGRQILDGLIDGRLRVLEGQGHEVAPELLAPIIAAFVCSRAVV